MPREGSRLPLELVVGEVVELVLDDRAAEGEAELLIRVRKNRVEHRVGRIQAGVPEVGTEGTRRGIATTFGDGVDLNA